MADSEQRDAAAAEPFVGTGSTAKDFAVYVPIIGTALAFAWEVGSFIPIGGSAFGMFSFSEHIVFALQALPIAITAAFLVVFIHLYYQRSVTTERLRRMRAHPTASMIGFVMGTAIVLWSMIFVTRAVGVPYPGFLVVALLIGLLTYVFMRMTEYRYAPKGRLISYTIVAVYIEIFAVFFGIDQTRNTLAVAETSLVQTTDGQFSIVVLRASQVGVIGYSRKEKNFMFLKAAAIKHRTWQSPFPIKF